MSCAHRRALDDRWRDLRHGSRTSTLVGRSGGGTCGGLGCFTTTITSGGDIYTLRQIIHDWDDELSIVILRRCARALAPGGKILVIEVVVEPGREALQTTLLGLRMLVLNGGRERTTEEYRRIFADAGLQVTRMIPTQADLSIIEGERLSSE